jgi:hypothetical protein
MLPNGQENKYQLGTSPNTAVREHLTITNVHEGRLAQHGNEGILKKIDIRPYLLDNKQVVT